MGTAGNSARPRIAHRLPIIAAVPALAGMAAAITMVSAPAAGAAVVSAHAAKAAAHHTTATAHKTAARKTAARTKADHKKADHKKADHKKAAKKARVTPVKYTVESGNTLSGIAQHFYGSTSYWPAIYWTNHSRIHYADDIQVGQVLTVPAKPARIPAAPSTLAAPAPVQSAPVQASTVQASTVQTSTVQTSTVQSAPVESAPVQSAPAYSAPAASTSVSTAGDSAFQACVIQAESGGDSQVMNSSGHYGLYQFSASTWAEYGGNPADFGDASVAEQNQVFDNAIAAGGESNWSAYDGC